MGGVGEQEGQRGREGGARGVMWGGGVTGGEREKWFTRVVL